MLRTYVGSWGQNYHSFKYLVPAVNEFPWPEWTVYIRKRNHGFLQYSGYFISYLKLKSAAVLYMSCYCKKKPQNFRVQNSKITASWRGLDGIVSGTLTKLLLSTMDSYYLIHMYEPNRIFNVLLNYYSNWISQIFLSSKKGITKYKNLGHT